MIEAHVDARFQLLAEYDQLKRNRNMWIGVCIIYTVAEFIRAVGYFLGW